MVEQERSSSAQGTGFYACDGVIEGVGGGEAFGHSVAERCTGEHTWGMVVGEEAVLERFVSTSTGIAICATRGQSSECWGTDRPAQSVNCANFPDRVSPATRWKCALRSSHSWACLPFSSWWRPAVLSL